MKPKLSQKASGFRKNISPVRQIMNMADPVFYEKNGLKSSDVISFAGGWVNHEAPSLMQKIYVDIVADNKLFHQSGGYTPTLGVPACRQAIVEFEKHVHNVKEISMNQVAVGANSTQITSDIFKVLLDPNDKILLLDPSYCNFPSQIISSIGANIIRFPVVDIESWQYVADKKITEFVEFIIKERPKVVLLISPDNPTSQILSHSFVSATLEAVVEVGGYLVIDFAYKELTFGEQTPEYYSWGPSDNFLSIHSNSKWCRGLGRRLGWLEAIEEVILALESIQSSSILCPDTLHQLVFAAYISESTKSDTIIPYIKNVRKIYANAAEVTSQSIEKYLGVPYFVPQGGLYTCMSIGRDGAQFVEDALRQSAVLLVPGWGFGRSQNKAVRISFGPLVNSTDTIVEGIKKLGQFLHDNK